MSELTVTRGPAAGTSITLSEEQVYTIGSGQDASLNIQGDDIAARHAVIKALKGGGFGIKGLAGPIVLNGKSVSAARLTEGDTLELGSHRIQFGQRAGEDGEAQREIGGFRLLGVLGKGGMGTVYRAEQVSLHREVALKVLSTELTSDPVFVARFQAEARAAARLHHPNVVQVFDVGHEGDTYFYSMELMHAGSLEHRLRAEGKLPVEDALQVVIDAAKGLGFAESMRIVHRDIKPDNLMVDQHGHVKLADLGLALEDEDQAGKLAGTPHFMSPEQVQRKPLDPRSDLYSLGCTFYRLLTGRTPFKGGTVKQILLAHVKEEPVPVHKVDPEIPNEVGAIVERLLEKDPDERYQSAAELVEELEELMAPAARRGLWIGGIVAAVLVAAGAIYWAATRPEPETRIIRETITDPNALRALEEARQKEAGKELEIVELRSRDLEPLAFAEALEKMAAGYEGTEAAGTALRRAEDVRAEVRRQVAEAAARQKAIDDATRELRADFERALSEADLFAAADLLRGEKVPEELRSEQKVSDLLKELGDKLQNAGADHLTRLRRAVDQAIAERKPDAIRTGLEPLDDLVAPDGGWPKAVLPDPGPLKRYISDARHKAEVIQSEILALAEAEAWTELRAALLADGAPIALISGMKFQDAAQRTGEVAQRLGEAAAGKRAALLLPPMRAAASFLTTFSQAVSEGALRMVHGEDNEEVPIVGVELTGDRAGFTVSMGSRVRPREELIPLASLRPRFCEVFTIPGDAAAADARDAFLALELLARHLLAADRYLAGLSAADDTTGTGPAAYPESSDDLVELADRISARKEEWAQALADELRAIDLLARGLQAMSNQRNMSAAGLIERLLRDFPDTIVVNSLK